MIDQPYKPNISHSDGELQKRPPSQNLSINSAKSSELNNSDQNILVVPNNLTKNVNSIQKDGMGGYRFVKVRNTYRYLV